jgi:hypothetical protein
MTESQKHDWEQVWTVEGRQTLIREAFSNLGHHCNKLEMIAESKRITLDRIESIRQIEEEIAHITELIGYTEPDEPTNCGILPSCWESPLKRILSRLEAIRDDLRKGMRA